MKKRISIDTLMNQTLGFNTKSFSESKTTISLNKKFNYGEVGNALLTFKSDKYAMIAEAATLKADLVTMKAFKEDSSKIIEKAKGAAKGVWETIKKLIGALIDLIKNFLRKFGTREKQLDAVIKGAEAVLARKLDSAKSDKLKDKKFKLPVSDKAVDAKARAAEIKSQLGKIGSRLLNNFVKATEKFTSPTVEGITEFVNTLVPGASSAEMDVIDFGDKLGATLKDIKTSTRATIKDTKESLKEKTVELVGTAAYEKAKAVLELTLESMKRSREAKPIDMMIKLQKGLNDILKTIKKGIPLEPSDAHLSQKVRVAVPTVTKALTKSVAIIEAEYARAFKVMGITTGVVTAFTIK